MKSGRIERIVVGTLVPPVLGGLLCACIGTIYELATSRFDFSWIRTQEALETLFSLIPISLVFIFFSLLFYGVQSFLYSLLMEYVVQELKSDKLVILISMLLGIFVVTVLGIGNIIGMNIGAEIANVVVFVGAVVGLIAGSYLRKRYTISKNKL